MLQLLFAHMRRGANQANPHDFAVGMLFIGGALALVISLYAVAAYRRRKRAQAMEEMAGSLGLEFIPKADGTFTYYLDGFELTSKGRAQKAVNVLQGKSDNRALALFDYQYTTGHGKSTHTWYTTVLKILFDGPPLPTFSIRPKNFSDTVMGWFGRKGLELGDNSSLSRQYILHGDDPLAVREVLTGAVADFFQNNTGYTAEANGNTLLVYRHGKRQPPAQLSALLGTGLELLALLNRQ